MKIYANFVSTDVDNIVPSIRRDSMLNSVWREFSLKYTVKTDMHIYPMYMYTNE